MPAGFPFDNTACNPCCKTGGSDFPGPLLYYPSRRHAPAPLRALVDYIKNS